MNFSHGEQPLVDTAFLAQGILRAPRVLWGSLAGPVRHRVVEALKASRSIATPNRNNWVLFAATVEAALQMMGEETVAERYEACVRQDARAGTRATAPTATARPSTSTITTALSSIPCCWMRLACHCREKDGGFAADRVTEQLRARRYAGGARATHRGPTGHFPRLAARPRTASARSTAWPRRRSRASLTARLADAQVRTALTAAIRRSVEAPGTFDDGGWLRIGLCGHQPSLAEGYISTGSLYLCCTALLPLGLPPSSPFWSGAACPMDIPAASGQGSPCRRTTPPARRVGGKKRVRVLSDPPLELKPDLAYSE